MREDPVTNAPVESLQLMLRTISFANGGTISVIPDGIYGDSTTRAVSEFQEKNGLPATGIVDEVTFGVIVNAYNNAFEQLDSAQSSVILFPTSLVIFPGQTHPHIRLVQAMFLRCGRNSPNFQPNPLSGTLDGITEQNIHLLQHFSILPETGAMDKVTWNRLNMLYRAMFDRDFSPSQG